MGMWQVDMLEGRPGAIPVRFGIVEAPSAEAAVGVAATEMAELSWSYAEITATPVRHVVPGALFWASAARPGTGLAATTKNAC